MKCKNCEMLNLGFFANRPDDYVCLASSPPSVVEDIESECTEYPEKTVTRFEKIKSMNIDELADYLSGVICDHIEDCPARSCSCHQCAKNWLEEEVEK